MKKIFLILLGVIFLCFLLPILFTNKFETEQTSTNENKSEMSKMYDYNKFSVIKLLHADTGVIEEIPLDTYLYNVVSAEMPADFHEEALKAQAIVARTYTIYKANTNELKHGEAHICDKSTCCQAWISKEDRLAKWKEEVRQTNWDKIVNAVDSTKGQVVTYEGQPINAFFHSNSGGATEIPLNVWGGSGYPYLQTVETVGEDAYSQYSSEVVLSKSEILDILKKNYPDIEINLSIEGDIQVLERTDSNRVKKIKFGSITLSGVEARNIFKLRSSNFTVEQEADSIKFKVIGYGHGVGMSQTGADSLAKQGKTAHEIINHYYTGVEIISY